MNKPDPRAAFAAHVTTLAASLDRIDYYRLLGVPRDAPSDDVKMAYHRVAGIYHPDAHRQANEHVQKCLSSIFKRMSEAYRVLNDYGRRKRYDASLAQGGTARMVETKREQAGPRSPDAMLKTPAGKRCFLQALQQIKRNDFAGAKLNLQLALNYEGQGAQMVKDKIAEVDALVKQNKK
jgi:DnaJ-class molecular chaperone